MKTKSRLLSVLFLLIMIPVALYVIGYIFGPWGPEIEIEQQKFVVEGDVVYMGVDEYKCSVYKIQTNSTEFTILGHETKNVIFSGTFEYLINNEIRGQVFGIRELENFTYAEFTIQNLLPELTPYVFLCPTTSNLRELVSKEMIRTSRTNIFVSDMPDVNIQYSETPSYGYSEITGNNNIYIVTNPTNWAIKKDKFACMSANLVWPQNIYFVDQNDGTKITFLNGTSWVVEHGYWGWYLDNKLINKEEVVEIYMVDKSRIDIVFCDNEVKILHILQNPQLDFP